MSLGFNKNSRTHPPIQLFRLGVHDIFFVFFFFFEEKIFFPFPVTPICEIYIFFLLLFFNTYLSHEVVTLFLFPYVWWAPITRKLPFLRSPPQEIICFFCSVNSFPFFPSFYLFFPRKNDLKRDVKSFELRE